MQLKTEQPTAGHLPWSDMGKDMLLAMNLLINSYGGNNRFADLIERENVKLDWKNFYHNGNGLYWTLDEDNLLKFYVGKRQKPKIANRSTCAIRNRMAILGLSTKGLRMHKDAL